MNNENKITQYFNLSDDEKEVTLIKTTTDNDTVYFGVNLTYSDFAEGTLNSIQVKLVSVDGAAKWIKQ